jgi:hypothetical protein
MAWLASQPVGVATVNRVADRHRRAIAQVVLAAIEHAHRAFSPTAVTFAVVESETAVMQALRPWVDALRDQLAETLPAVLQSVVVASAREMVAIASSRETFRSAASGAAIQMSFDADDPDAEAWAQSKSGTLVVQITDETLVMVRSVLAEGVREKLPPRQVAQTLRTVVGLTNAQAQAVMRVRAAIVASPGGLVQAAKMRIRVPADGATEEFVARRTAQYASRLLTYRTTNIARTEGIAASVRGQQAAWQRARSHGYLTGREKRKWITSFGACPLCVKMSGKTTTIDGYFHSPDFGSVSGPPLHPSCRCGTGLVVR